MSDKSTYVLNCNNCRFADTTPQEFDVATFHAQEHIRLTSHGVTFLPVTTKDVVDDAPVYTSAPLSITTTTTKED
jgi:hypothetical protein